MFSKLRTLALAGVVAGSAALGSGVRSADAQVVVNTPGLSIGVGAPVVGAYPGYGVYPVVPGLAPLYPVRPYAAYGGYGYYGPRHYGHYPHHYHHHGYRRW